MIGSSLDGITGQHWFLVLPELMLLAGIVLLPFVGKIVKDVRARQELALLFVAFALLATLLLLLPRGRELVNVDPTQVGPFLGVYAVDDFSLFFKVVFLLVALLVVLVSPTAVKPASRNAEYYTLLLVATFGMMVVASATDLLTLFVGLETAALASYPLAGYRKDDARSTEAAVKFVVIGALASSLTLYGISLLYAAAGTIRLSEIATLAGSAAGLGPGALLAVGFLVAGFGFKVTTVPFHMWAPDVYDGAPTPVSALLAASSKKMGLAAFFKVFFVGLLAVKFQWDVAIGILAVLTMTIGNLVALRQSSIKRILAWSSVGQAGYILIAFPVGTQYALAGGLFHVLTHAVMKGGAFALVAVLAARGIGDTLDSWRGLYRRLPVHAFTMALLMFSMAGIPPLAGFASKFVLFSSAIDAGVVRENNWLIMLAVAGIANSVLSLGYYLKVVRIMFVDDEAVPSTSAAPTYRAPVWAALYIVLVGVLFIGIWPEPFIQLATNAAAALLATP